MIVVYGENNKIATILEIANSENFTLKRSEIWNSGVILHSTYMGYL